ncbi:MAG: hypothetical protein HQK50_03835 [Oligoflexia bacterium]|nr:hypothetical protein [Oligoflexia bacterium]MBF0364675.1 hypothetical protein [Oligoflexia bacterium]
MFESLTDFENYAKESSLRNILLIGARGGLCHLLIKLLWQINPHIKITAIDNTEPNYTSANMKFIKNSFHRGIFENLLKNQHFHAILCLGHYPYFDLVQNKKLYRQVNISPFFPHHIQEIAAENSVERFLFLSSHMVSTLTSSSSLYPSKKINLFDYIALCDSRIERRQQSPQTYILRPCLIVGPSLDNFISRYLRYPVLPYLYCSNFDQVKWQFLHEYDMVKILLFFLFAPATYLPPGEYNIAPPTDISNFEHTLPMLDVFAILKKRSIPLPLTNTLHALSVHIPTNNFLPLLLYGANYFRTLFCENPLLDSSKLYHYYPHVMCEYDAASAITLSQARF